MSELRLSYPACMLAEKSKFTAEDVTLIENRIFAGGLDAPGAIATLLALEHCNAGKCPEWDAFFVQILSDHVIHTMHPLGALSEAKVEWLRRVLSRGGLISSRNELEVLVRVMEMAGPQSRMLTGFALSQVWHAIIDGEGALASHNRGLWTAMGMKQLSYINRVLTALGNTKPFSLRDAEALFDPAHNLVPDGQQTVWQEFVAAVAGPDLEPVAIAA